MSFGNISPPVVFPAPCLQLQGFRLPLLELPSGIPHQLFPLAPKHPHGLASAPQSCTQKALSSLCLPASPQAWRTSWALVCCHCLLSAYLPKCWLQTGTLRLCLCPRNAQGDIRAEDLLRPRLKRRGPVSIVNIVWACAGLLHPSSLV